jgi:hypothetical protein
MPITTKKIFVLLFVSVAGFGFIKPTKAQTFAEIDYVVINKMYDFLIDYERTVNATKFDQRKFTDFYYNTNVEVYNDLSSDLPEYIPFKEYLAEFETLKTREPGYKFFHYNLELLRQQEGNYFDIVHIRLLKEIEIDTTKKNISNSIKIDSSFLDMTLLFNKFANDGDGVFKIMKIEKAKSSLRPDAWHKNIIPDEVKVSLGPTFINHRKLNNQAISTSNNYGFEANVSIQNRITGGQNLALSWTAGIGIARVNSSWALSKDDTTLLNQEDDYLDEYTRIISSRNVKQDLTYSYLKVPIGLTLRLFNDQSFSLSLAGNFSPYYLFSSNQQTNHGSIRYSGKYTIDNTDFILSEVNGYDYFEKLAVTGREHVQFSEFGATAGITVQANFAISRRIDVFVAPSWNWALTKMLESNTNTNLLSYSDWEANPIIEQEPDIRFNKTSIQAGVIFRLNNIVKPFIEPTRFKDAERKQQKDSFDKYLVNQIPYDPPKYEKPQLKKVNLLPSSNNYKRYNGKVKYAFSIESGIEGKKIKSKKNNRIRASHHGLFLFKPFGYDIYSASYNPDYNAFKNVYVDSLEQNPVDLKIRHYPDLNINIVMGLNKETNSENNVRMKIIDAFKKNLPINENEQCALYFYETHGTTFENVYNNRNEMNIGGCNESMLEDLNKNTKKIEHPYFNFLTELRVLLRDEFIVERRNINMDFYMAGEDEFREVFIAFQSFDRVNNELSEPWVDSTSAATTRQNLLDLQSTLQKHPLKLNQFKNIHFHYNNYNEYLQTEIMDWVYNPDHYRNVPNDPFSLETYRLLYHYIKSNGTGNKPVRLRNFEFIKQ